MVCHVGNGRQSLSLICIVCQPFVSCGLAVVYYLLMIPHPTVGSLLLILHNFAVQAINSKLSHLVASVMRVLVPWSAGYLSESIIFMV